MSGIPCGVWRQVGGEAGGDYTIERGPWRIVPSSTPCDLAASGTRRTYTLYRAAEMHGVFPSTHEAAVHADMVEADLA